ncbi:diaminopimelate epimerase [bacterium]|nr:diaminopimelate epimerase [candidate division CSSED10-310 bacterium]
MNIQFSKYHGLGNDYLFLDAIADPGIRDLPFSHLARIMSHRRLGPGADGIVIILPAREAIAAMRIFNSDGSEAENCGNALRCLARICREKNYSTQSQFMIESLSGTVEVTLGESDDEFNHIGVKMTSPSWQRNDLPMLGDGLAGRMELIAKDRCFDVTCLSVGNPHCVVFLDDYSENDVLLYGPTIENHPWFPKRINACFSQINNRRTIRLTVWERGAGLTGACGTGATAAFAAARQRGLVDDNCTVKMPGGSLEFLQKPDLSIHMFGPAVHVYDGVFKLDSLCSKFDGADPL